MLAAICLSCASVAVRAEFAVAPSLVLTNCAEASLIAAVNAGGVVALRCAGTITLSKTLVVSTDLTLDTGGENVTISGGNSNRLFQVNSKVTLTLKNLTLANGHHGSTNTNAVTRISGNGGAILNEGGTVILENCNVTNNRVVGSFGARGSDAAVGDANDGEPGGAARGGAIFNNEGTVIARNTRFTANIAEGGEGGTGGNGSANANGGDGGEGGDGGAGLGGAIYNTANGVVELSDSTFSSNRVTGASGGFAGIGGGALGLDGSHGTPAIGGGGAVYNARGRITISNCTFSSNTSLGAAGNNGYPGFASRDGSDGELGSAALGAALFNDGGSIVAMNATFAGNALAGGPGGFGGDGGPTGFGGNGGDGAKGGPAHGAGLYNRDRGVAVLVNCTFSSNSTVGGTGGNPGKGGGFTGRNGRAGGQGSARGGGIFNEDGTVRLKNSILAYTEDGGNCGGALIDEGNNITSDESCGFVAPTSFNKTNPRLGPLADNGGLTQTVALLTNSPAINTGDMRDCPVIDQRGSRRSGPCDIGAFEFGGFSPDFVLTAQSSSTNGVALSWPASNLGLVLEATDTLAPQSIWTTVTNRAAVSGGQNTVTLNATNRSGYFRLRRP